MTVSSKLFFMFTISRRGGSVWLVYKDSISNKCIKGIGF